MQCDHSWKTAKSTENNIVTSYDFTSAYWYVQCFFRKNLLMLNSTLLCCIVQQKFWPVVNKYKYINNARFMCPKFCTNTVLKSYHKLKVTLPQICQIFMLRWSYCQTLFAFDLTNHWFVDKNRLPGNTGHYIRHKRPARSSDLTLYGFFLSLEVFIV